MNIFPVARLVSSALLLTPLIVVNYAYADSSTADNNDVANNLLPLETRTFGIEANPSLFKSVIDEININSPAVAEDSETADVLGAGFLEELVDENGDVDLPLGITVFEAMGQTSIGFGGDF